MGIFRTEHNVVSGETITIQQKAYINDAGEVMVLDDLYVPPDGYVEFDPSEISED